MFNSLRVVEPTSELTKFAVNLTHNQGVSINKMTHIYKSPFNISFFFIQRRFINRNINNSRIFAAQYTKPSFLVHHAIAVITADIYKQPKDSVSLNQDRKS